MCLYDKDETPKQIKYGYKIFVKKDNSYLGGLFTHCAYKSGEWYDAEIILLHDFFFSTYESGFHAFINKEDAELVAKKLGDPAEYTVPESDVYDIRKVEVEDITASGVELVFGKLVNVVVAKRMYIH